MPKRRSEKNKVKLDFIPKECSTEEVKPKCFGEWEPYCNKDLCGKYYEKCFKKGVKNE